MNDSIREFLKSLAQQYKAVAAHVGQEMPGKTITNVAKNSGGEVKARVSGPLDELWGFSVRNLIEQLDALEPFSRLNLTIDSVGGRLNDGTILYQDLRKRASAGVEITTEASGVVASAAVMPYLAGDSRLANETTEIMVHKPNLVAIVMGTADEINSRSNKIINMMKSGENMMRTVYNKRIGVSNEKIDGWLANETWFSGKESVAAGISTELVDLSGNEPDEELNDIVTNLFNGMVDEHSMELMQDA